MHIEPWLYAVVAPTTGAAFGWELPRWDAACFTIFLDYWSRQDAVSLHLVLLEQALAHIA